MTAYRSNDWGQLIGIFVEVRKDYEFFRAGFVDDAMVNSSVLWLRADENHGRILISAADGCEVWVQPRELEGKHRYRMTASALQRTPIHRQVEREPMNIR
jgi:hypothetical protein